MAIAQGATNTFKVGLPSGTFNFSSGTFKIALYTGAASIGPDTTAYTALNEVIASGYTGDPSRPSTSEAQCKSEGPPIFCFLRGEHSRVGSCTMLLAERRRQRRRLELCLVMAKVVH